MQQASGTYLEFYVRANFHTFCVGALPGLALVCHWLSLIDLGHYWPGEKSKVIGAKSCSAFFASMCYSGGIIIEALFGFG